MVCRLIRIYGIVQGVGFRPFVSRLADRYGISGSVCNKGSYVEIIARADESVIGDFVHAIEAEAPERSAIVKVKVMDSPVDISIDSGFKIALSKHEDGQIFVSPDIATCPDCARELFDKNNRRYLHPFINCTQCGPRLTILDSMPYDRVKTSMAGFPMCEACSDEYTDMDSRRYHAQPVCCNDCGPELYTLVGRASESDVQGMGTDSERPEGAYGAAALLETRAVIRSGGIAAIKGIGGFHLCCDAGSEAAVQRLRQLKARPMKPFAVMMRDLEVVGRECKLEPEMEPLLTGPQKPIILIPRRHDSAESAEPDSNIKVALKTNIQIGHNSRIAASVAPDNPNLGVMLPYTPVHLLLFNYPDDEPISDVLVMTSGNPSGAPICMNDEEALKYLSPMCDIILSNSRDIRIRADDTVMAFYRSKPYMIRRSRGYSPLPIVAKSESSHAVLGIGGELKNAFCLGDKGLFYPSPYIGDMADMRSVRALEAATTRMERLLEIHPDIIVGDMHPGYNTSEMARVIAEREGVPVMEVQHHHAHMVSCMAENEYEGTALGVTFDGTGYGPDGTIWGGEFLLGDESGYERVGSIAPFIHAGGDIASREGWRIAYSMISTALGSEAANRIGETLGLGDEKGRQSIDFMLGNNINTVKSTSAGRLFDAVSAVLGIKSASTFEGEASMALQFAAERAEAQGISLAPYEGRLMNIDEEQFELCTDTLLMELAARSLADQDTDQLAYFFHKALADMIVIACCYQCTRCDVNVVAISGGVFQNLLLLRLVDDGLEREGFKVLKHGVVPTNDGGIALGQAAAGIAALRDEEQNKEQ
ncbi:MAG: carbamoyltransferase HypF [Mogibacterium diversum]|uniref:carbamoyltransferase HypF n=1 Tax=Mogibacterium diversum TaxID=114527 RepID=UPI00204B81E5|nr:carbamoyltransferase HypF [Mogibacterium diversum]UQF80958.1 MAG: carbamoyltransferase HypF [Mogibacterium diversum]